MRKLNVLLVVTLLFLTSCANFGLNNPELLQTENENEGEVLLVPKHALAEKQYKVVLPFRPSAARGVIDYQMNNRIDINEIETGLQRHSATVFDPKKYYFEEGQYLKKENVLSLIDSLNPPKIEKGDGSNTEELIEKYKQNPRVFSHLLEQNYLVKSDDNTAELAGVSIGIALKSLYRFQVDIGGPFYEVAIPEDEMLEEGKRIANEVLHILRDYESLRNVPIFITLFREQEPASPIPGNFVAKTFVDEGMVAIGKWQDVNEENVLFPSNHAKSEYFDDYQRFEKFGNKISEYFPNYVGVIGNGFYEDETLKRLSIEIPMEFHGQSELIGFTQYVYGLLMQEFFKNQYDLEIKITSSNRTEALIYRKAGDMEPFVHIFH